VPRTDDGEERRAAKFTILLRNFEDYINEVLTSDHGMKPQEMAALVIENFRRAMLANVEYHNMIALPYEHNGESVKAAYHRVMANVYKKLLRD
jgi:hypothetical protein